MVDDDLGRDHSAELEAEIRERMASMPDKGRGVHAHPATLVALVIFTMVSLGLGIVANVVGSRKAGFLQEVLFWGIGRSGALSPSL